jgi:hypothetical protein
MPIILWLLGVPVTLVLVLWFFGFVGFKRERDRLCNACAPVLPIRRLKRRTGFAQSS